LPTIREQDRRAEKHFWAEFEKVRPKILGALLEVVSGALRRLPEIERKSDTELPRLADFHQWGEAADVPLGLEPGMFVEAYRANREVVTQTVLESSPVVAALLRFVRKNPQVEETAARLLEKLGSIDSEFKTQPGWPKCPRVLSAILKRVAPNLRQVGIVAVQDTRGGGNTKEKVWRIERRDGGESSDLHPASPVRPAASGLLAAKIREMKEGRTDR